MIAIVKALLAVIPLGPSPLRFDCEFDAPTCQPDQASQ
jgi:hypothetical protein